MMACMFRTHPHKIVPKIVPMLILSVPKVELGKIGISIKKTFFASLKSFYGG